MIQVRKGDTSELVTVRPDLADDTEVIGSGWKCYSSVEDIYGNEVVAQREITEKTADNLHFVAFLNPSETDLLNSGSLLTEYRWVFRISNNTTDPEYNREKYVELFCVT